MRRYTIHLRLAWFALRMRTIRIAWLLGRVMAAALVAGCGGGNDSNRAQGAIRRAIPYLEAAADGQPHALAFGYFLRRRFGIEAFADAPARYDAIVATIVAPKDPKRRTLPRAGALRLFRRLVVPEATYVEADMAEAEGSLDRTTVTALYCDRLPPPEGYADLIRTEAAAGDYQLTHAVMALAWIRDNECPDPVPLVEVEGWMARLAALARSRPAHDVGLEAAALLAYMGEGGRLPADHLAAVLAAQQPDGGWRPCPAPPCDPPTGLRPEAAASHWHPTALALWLLLETSTERPLDRFVPSGEPVT